MRSEWQRRHSAQERRSQSDGESGKSSKLCQFLASLTGCCCRSEATGSSVVLSHVSAATNLERTALESRRSSVKLRKSDGNQVPLPSRSLKELLGIGGSSDDVKSIQDITTDVAYYSILQMITGASDSAMAHQTPSNSRRLYRVLDGCSGDGELLTVSKYMPQDMLRFTWKLSQFQITSLLHSGYASNVYTAQCLLSSNKIVIKQYRLCSLTILERIHLFREITIHSQLHHPYIAQFYASFKCNDCVYIVIEHVQGLTLHNYLKHSLNGKLAEGQAVRHVVHKLLMVVHYLHAQRIVHRDIKPENIMVVFQSKAHGERNFRTDLKLLDFGLAIDLNYCIATTRAGTLQYMAPEVLACQSKPIEGDDAIPAATESADDVVLKYSYDTQADVWAIGAVTYEILVGMSPFSDHSDSGILERICTFKIGFPSKMSDHAKDFIKGAMCWFREDRASVRQLLSHSWIADNLVKPGGVGKDVDNSAQSIIQIVDTSGTLKSLRP